MYFIQTKVVYDCFKLIGILKLLNLKMPQSLQIQTQKYSEEAKSCMKVKNKKAVKSYRENVMKSQTKQENQNCKNFVTLNKRKTFKKTCWKNVRKHRRIRKSRFYLFKYPLFFIMSGIHDLVRKTVSYFFENIIAV